MIDHFYQIEHRRLRERFSMETLERHQDRIQSALRSRRLRHPLPCPFCGRPPVTERTGFSRRAMQIYCINDNGCPRPKAIGETEEKAIKNWNLRA